MKEKLKKIRSSRIVSFIFILVFIAICMGIGAAFAYIDHESDPTEVAVQYFRAFVQQDYDTMYDCLTKKEGYYISKKMYIDSMKKMRQEYVIDSYEILDADEERGKQYITIKCKNSGTNENRDFIVYVDSVRNGVNIIPEYSVNIDSMIVKKFSVIIPNGNRLELNSEIIKEDMVDVSAGENDTKVYKFEGLLFGNYKVSATNKYYAMNDNISLKKSGVEIDMTKKSYTASDEYSSKITGHGNKVIGQFYKAVRGREPKRSKLLTCFENNKKLRKKVQSLVEQSEEIVYWPETKNIDNYKVIDMNIKGLKHNLAYNAKRKVYTLKYTYNYDYVASTETALYTSYMYRISGKCKSEMTLSYSRKGDDISLTDIKLKNKNIKNQE